MRARCYQRGAGNDSALHAPLRSYAERFGFYRSITELYRIIQLFTRCYGVMPYHSA